MRSALDDLPLVRRVQKMPALDGNCERVVSKPLPELLKFPPGFLTQRPESTEFGSGQRH
jgi:hypothetical protein